MGIAGTSQGARPAKLRSVPPRRTSGGAGSHARHDGARGRRDRGPPPRVLRNGFTAEPEALQRGAMHRATIRSTMSRSVLAILNLGPVEAADVTLGDLTVFMGP